VRLTLVTGFAATLLSAFLAFGFCAWAAGRAWGPRAAAWLAPILATPHSAFAIGLAFVIAPSGWIVRALSPWLTGFDVPPDVSTVGHPSGAALVLGMVVKEAPYLVLMTVAALAQVRAAGHLAVARSMGYGPAEAWVRVVLPQVWPQVRLPFLAVLAYSLSVVDVALILARAIRRRSRCSPCAGSAIRTCACGSPPPRPRRCSSSSSPRRSARGSRSSA
jgi:putative thiamine transport system permease protein